MPDQAANDHAPPLHSECPLAFIQLVGWYDTCVVLFLRRGDEYGTANPVYRHVSHGHIQIQQLKMDQGQLK